MHTLAHRHTIVETVYIRAIMMDSHDGDEDLRFCSGVSASQPCVAMRTPVLGTTVSI